MRDRMLEPGTLWQKTLAVTEQALRSGALKPIATEGISVRDGGVDFLIRSVSSLERKAAERVKEVTTQRKDFNPFLPYDEELFVADLSDTHVCLLNKYNVIDHHLLIVTREFEHQELLLTREDFEATWLCMAEIEGLAFYNGGVVAGASQPHRHLQMIPVPLAEQGPGVPIESVLLTATSENGPGSAPDLPFAHSAMRLAPGLASAPADAAKKTHDIYRRMMRDAGLVEADAPDQARQTGPYNLLFTREWMMLVPRSREFFDSISVNALGFAGALLVRNEQEMRALKRAGPMTALISTGIARESR